MATLYINGYEPLSSAGVPIGAGSELDGASGEAFEAVDGDGEYPIGADSDKNSGGMTTEVAGVPSVASK